MSIVYGGRPGRIDLRRLGADQGFALTGEGTGSILGGPAAAVGDFDGDGRGDLALTLAPFPRPNDGRIPQPRDVAVVPLGPTPEAAARPGRNDCVAVRLRTRTLRQALREGRVRGQVRAARRGRAGYPFLSANLFVELCEGPRCVLEPAPGARRVSLPEIPGRWSPVTIGFGPRTERLLRDRRARALTLCANEEPCVDLPVRR